VKLVNSSWFQRWLRENMDIDAKLLIGGVNTDLFYPAAPERQTGSPFRILCSGDPRTGKGTDTVREAVHIVRHEHPDVKLEEYYGREVPQNEMAAVYSSADLFADASRNDGGWNNPVAEAMACRVPVVCTHNGQVEDFAFEGQTALMSPPSDAAALAANILRIIREPELRDRIARAGYDHIRTFEWDKSIDQFEKIAAEHIGDSR
jgi:glycosyltransferase involved in cell wall biosynthesis